MTFNEVLWWCPNNLGWLFWAPLIPAGAYGLWMIYRLAPALSRLGRGIHVVLSMGCLSLVFIPVFNGLGPYALHLLAIGGCLYLRRIWEMDVAAGRIKKPRAETAVERLAERMVEKVS